MSDFDVNADELRVEAQALENESMAMSQEEILQQIEPAQAQTKQAEQQRQNAEQEYGQMVGMILSPAFSILAPAWNIQAAEIEALSQCYAAVLAKYWPDTTTFGTEVSAVIVTAAILGPRLTLPRKVTKKPEADAKEATQEDSAG